MKTPALPGWVKTDVSFSLSVGQFRKCAYHIRAVVDDNMVVMCHWVKSRQRWEYEAEIERIKDEADGLIGDMPE